MALASATQTDGSITAPPARHGRGTAETATTPPSGRAAARSGRVEAAGLAAGILALDADTARRYTNDGLRFIGVGSDATLLDRTRRT